MEMVGNVNVPVMLFSETNLDAPQGTEKTDYDSKSIMHYW